jgi:hypothetical protein
MPVEHEIPSNEKKIVYILSQILVSAQSAHEKQLYTTLYKLISNAQAIQLLFNVDSISLLLILFSQNKINKII